jgi:hypothetical protein
MNKSIVIFSHSRAELLRDSIESIFSATGSAGWKKVLVCQLGFKDVEQIASDYEKQFDLVIRVNRQFDTALASINFNRILGTSICFDVFQSELVLGIEEDTKISKDALAFIEETSAKYQSNRAFRGINLGSLQPRTDENLNSYSLLRYGLHGQAGVLTRRSWNYFSSEELLKNIADEGWDSRIEPYLKSGFMITSNLSRFLDRGWAGTHSPSDPSHPHYVKLNRSWVGEDSDLSQDFFLQNINHDWRIDAVTYRKVDSILFMIKRSPRIRRLYQILQEFRGN